MLNPFLRMNYCIYFALLSRSSQTLLGHTVRDSPRDPVEIYFFITGTSLVQLFFRKLISSLIFSRPENLVGEDSALATLRANFNVARTFASRASSCTEVKNLPDNKREVTFNSLFLLFACCPRGSNYVAAMWQSRVALTWTTLRYISQTTNI